MSLDIAKIKLKALLDSPTFNNNYTIFVESLKLSGLVDFLRSFARPYITDGGANPNIAASQAAFCDGYNKCLDDLLHFRELYGQVAAGSKSVKPNFGALGIAYQRGDLTKEDWEKLNGK